MCKLQTFSNMDLPLVGREEGEVKYAWTKVGAWKEKRIENMLEDNQLYLVTD